MNGWPLVQLQMKAGSNKIEAAHHPRERAAPISVNSPRPQEVGVATIPTRNCGQLVVTKSVRRQILERVAVMTQAPLRFYRSPTGSPNFITTPH